MKYIISYSEPHHHYIDIEFIVENVTTPDLEIQLPAWRPGRYELGNFAKNIQQWAAFDENGQPLKHQKISKDRWRVQTANASSIHIKYNYYGADLNAGSTYLDESMLYVNPVNCCLYLPERVNEKCILELRLPPAYNVACAMEQLGVSTENNTTRTILAAADFHELADCPFMASATLQHSEVIVDHTTFHLWFQGECTPVWDKINRDFSQFIAEQINTMKSFPVKVYHFLFHILPYRMYHGVEHLSSTVIALGPSYNLMRNDLYAEFLGVSSHELFHAWNIKTIRPVEMQPYDYTRESYSRLGYVCEGITTYYGDLFLYRCHLFNDETYFATFNERLQKHMDNFGRFNLSVADSSFDTWLDGYTAGVPNRKTSIYDEGCLLAFIADVLIRKGSENRNSLDDAMRYLYAQFGVHQKGYSEADYKQVLEELAGESLAAYFNNYVYSASSYEVLLNESLNYFGLELLVTASKKYHECYYGIKVIEHENGAKVTHVYPASIADKAGVKIGDDIVAINGFKIKNDFSDWARYFGQSLITLTLSNSAKIRSLDLLPQTVVYYKIYQVRKMQEPFEQQVVNFELWSKHPF